ncbi:hypothetical protein JCM10212_000568 [Sporobolomyces blumeae]
MSVLIAHLLRRHHAPVASSPPPLAPSLAEPVASLSRRLRDLESHQVPELRDCNGPLHWQQELVHNVRQELATCRRDLDELKLEVDDLVRAKDRQAASYHVDQLQQLLDTCTKLYRAAVVQSKRQVDSQAHLFARDELLSAAGGSQTGGRDSPAPSARGGSGFRSATPAPGGGPSGDDALMSATSDVTEGLRRTLQLMQQEVDRSLASNELLEAQTQTMQMATKQYSTLSTLLSTSKTLITSLERADVLDRLLLFFAFSFFVAVCAYIFKKRVVDRGLRVAGAVASVMGRAGGGGGGFGEAREIMRSEFEKEASAVAAATAAVFGAVKKAQHGIRERSHKAFERREERRSVEGGRVDRAQEAKNVVEEVLDDDRSEPTAMPIAPLESVASSPTRIESASDAVLSTDALETPRATDATGDLGVAAAGDAEVEEEPEEEAEAEAEEVEEAEEEAKEEEDVEDQTGGGGSVFEAEEQVDDSTQPPSPPIIDLDSTAATTLADPTPVEPASALDEIPTPDLTVVPSPELLVASSTPSVPETVEDIVPEPEPASSATAESDEILPTHDPVSSSDSTSVSSLGPEQQAVRDVDQADADGEPTTHEEEPVVVVAPRQEHPPVPAHTVDELDQLFEPTIPDDGTPDSIQESANAPQGPHDDDERPVASADPSSEPSPPEPSPSTVTLEDLPSPSPSATLEPGEFEPAQDAASVLDSTTTPLDTRDASPEAIPPLDVEAERTEDSVERVVELPIDLEKEQTVWQDSPESSERSRPAPEEGVGSASEETDRDDDEGQEEEDETLLDDMIEMQMGGIGRAEGAFGAYVANATQATDDLGSASTIGPSPVVDEVVRPEEEAETTSSSREDDGPVQVPPEPSMSATPSADPDAPSQPIVQAPSPLRKVEASESAFDEGLAEPDSTRSPATSDDAFDESLPTGSRASVPSPATSETPASIDLGDVPASESAHDVESVESNVPTPESTTELLATDIEWEPVATEAPLPVSVPLQTDSSSASTVSATPEIATTSAPSPEQPAATDRPDPEMPEPEEEDSALEALEPDHVVDALAPEPEIVSDDGTAASSATPTPRPDTSFDAEDAPSGESETAVEGAPLVAEDSDPTPEPAQTVEPTSTQSIASTQEATVPDASRTPRVDVESDLARSSDDVPESATANSDVVFPPADVDEPTPSQAAAEAEDESVFAQVSTEEEDEVPGVASVLDALVAGRDADGEDESFVVARDEL